MSKPRRPGRSPARYLAPVALLATIAGTYLVVHSDLAGHPTAPAAKSPSHASGHAGSHTLTVGGSATQGPQYYSVRPGDSLYAIAARTHVPLATLEALNPHVSATSLHVGQRIKLRR